MGPPLNLPQGLSSQDALVRAICYECLELAQKSLASKRDEQSAQGFQGGGQEEPQPLLMALLQHVRNGTRRHLEKWPNSSTMLVAEICLGLCHPSSSSYPLLLRALLKKEAMGVNDAVDLGMRLILGGLERDRGGQQSWALGLLMAGIESREDGRIYRQRNVVEVLTAMKGGPAMDEEANQAVSILVKRCSRL